MKYRADAKNRQSHREKQKKVVEIVKDYSSKTDAISMLDLAEEVEVSDGYLRRLIRELRAEGVRIMSSNGCRGYWYEKGMSENA